MTSHPNSKSNSSNKHSSGGGNRHVNAGTNFSKQAKTLPKPPTTTVNNHTHNTKGQKKG